jgi:hypothetical protein
MTGGVALRRYVSDTRLNLSAQDSTGSCCVQPWTLDLSGTMCCMGDRSNNHRKCEREPRQSFHSFRPIFSWCCRTSLESVCEKSLPALCTPLRCRIKSVRLTLWLFHCSPPLTAGCAMSVCMCHGTLSIEISGCLRRKSREYVGAPGSTFFVTNSADCSFAFSFIPIRR